MRSSCFAVLVRTCAARLIPAFGTIYKKPLIQGLFYKKKSPHSG